VLEPPELLNEPKHPDLPWLSGTSEEASLVVESIYLSLRCRSSSNTSVSNYASGERLQKQLCKKIKKINRMFYCVLLRIGIWTNLHTMELGEFQLLSSPCGVSVHE